MSTRKKIKGQKNIPAIHDEVKKQHGVFITPSSWAWLQQKAKSDKTSASEIIEALIRKAMTHGT